MKKIFVLFLLALSVSASARTAERADSLGTDSAVFVDCLSNTFAKFYNLSLLQRIYEHLVWFEKDTLRSDSYVFTGKESVYKMAVPVDRANDAWGTRNANELVGTEEYYHVNRTLENPKFPDSLRTAFNECFHECRKGSPKQKIAIKELIAGIEAFDSLPGAKPSFYVDIRTKFDGNIEAYAKDIYKNSFLLNASCWQRFLRHPSAQQMREDPGVRFVFSLKSYAQDAHFSKCW